jgi:hypothetical protein
MGPIVCPETSVQDYHSTLRNTPEERGSHLHRVGSLKVLRLVIRPTYCCRPKKTTLTLAVEAQTNVTPLGVYERYSTYSRQIHWAELQLCLVRVSYYCYFPLCSLWLELCIYLLLVPF